MTNHATADDSHNLTMLARGSLRAFAAKVGIARAVLGWSRSEFGARVGLTRRAISELEQSDTDPRRTTVRAIEEAWRERGIEFKDLADGGLRAGARSLPLDRPAPVESRRHAGRADLGVTRIGPPADSPRLRARPGFLLTLQGAARPSLAALLGRAIGLIGTLASPFGCIS